MTNLPKLDVEQLRNENQTLKKQLDEAQYHFNITDHLISSSGLMAWMVNVQLEFIYLSPAFVKRYHAFTGVRVEPGQKVFDVFPEDYIEIWKGRFYRALSGESFQVEEKIIGTDENEYFNLSISPLTMKGQPLGVQVYINETTELRKAEKKEYASLKKLKGILNQIQDLYYEIDMEGKITELSPAVKNFSNYTRDELIGKDVALLYKRVADRETFLNAIKQKGLVKDYVIELADKDGSPKNISVNATLVSDNKGQPEKVVGIIRDVTEMEKNNNDLRWLRRAMEQSPVSIVITDINGNIEYTNPAFTKVTHYTKEEAYKQNPSMLKSGKQTTSFYRDMWDTILNGNVWEGEFHNKRKDGSLFIERAIISPVKDDEGKIANFIAIKENITETTMALAEIKHLKTFNERIINTMREGIVVENADGEILFTNPAFADMTGYQITELTGQQWDEVTGTKSCKEILLENTETPEVLCKSVESELKCKDGSTVPVLMSGSLIQDGRKYMGLISVFTDITHIKENEKKLTEALEKAQLSDKLKSSFLANVSHEIRTPMNAILGFSEILRLEKNLDEQTRDKYFSIIELKGTELLQVISDVIDISKIEAKMMPLHIQEVAVDTLLDKILTSFQKELKISGKESVILSKNIPDGSGAVVFKVDADRLNQVFLNLLHNAGKFTYKGEISIGYSIHDTYLEFFVKDTGIGISPENQPFIFDRFRKVEEGYTHLHGGTGLGLNICKNLVEMMGGSIRVESELNVGSTFFVNLPR